jgi:hypothetical protein
MNTTSFSDTVKTLSDRGYANAEIAQSTGASRHKVGAVLAHHWHPESWKHGNRFPKTSKTSGKAKQGKRNIIGFAIIFG